MAEILRGSTLFQMITVIDTDSLMFRKVMFLHVTTDYQYEPRDLVHVNCTERQKNKSQLSIYTNRLTVGLALDLLRYSKDKIIYPNMTYANTINLWGIHWTQQPCLFHFLHWFYDFYRHLFVDLFKKMRWDDTAW